MALLPMGLAPEDRAEETQESMFEDTTGFPGHDYVEAPDQVQGQPEHLQAYEPEEPDQEPESQVESSSAFGLNAPAGSAATQEALTEPQPITVLSVDDFAALEERVLKAVNLVRRERQSRSAAEERVTALEAQLQGAQSQNSVMEQLQDEVDSLRAEREQVRQRVERLLGQLDALEL